MTLIAKVPKLKTLGLGLESDTRPIKPLLSYIVTLRQLSSLSTREGFTWTKGIIRKNC